MRYLTATHIFQSDALRGVIYVLISFFLTVKLELNGGWATSRVGHLRGARVDQPGGETTKGLVQDKRTRADRANEEEPEHQRIRRERGGARPITLGGKTTI